VWAAFSVRPTATKGGIVYEIVIEQTITVPPQAVWDYLIDVSRWWPVSNPEHVSIEVLSADGTIEPGARIRLVERIAGVPGEAEGAIRSLVEGELVTWTSDRCVYHYRGVPVHVEEGGEWRLASVDGGTRLAFRGWARFPPGPFGRLTEWYFKRVLHGVELDYAHSLRELLYVKKALEQGAGQL